jgi:transposase
VDYAAIDLHKKESQIRIVTAAGEVLDERVTTTRAALTRVFAARARTRILLEASTESEWVAQALEALGHEVVVADPNYGLMYGMRDRRIKTDLRDVAALVEACRRGIYRPVHRRSARQREVQAHLLVRQTLVRTRTRVISVVRALARGAGARIPSGHVESFGRRVEATALPEAMRTVVKPLLDLLTTLQTHLATADSQVAAYAAGDRQVQRLQTMPMVGPVTAVALVAALDTPTRFASAGQVTSYLGLVPQEASSGERQRRGHVTRSAHPAVRALLVQTAWRVWRSTTPQLAALRAWAQQVAARRGKRLAIVGLARRLMRIVFAMWRDDRPFLTVAAGAAGA